MNIFRLVLFVAALLVPCVARAQTTFYNQPGAPPGSGTGGFYSITAGTSSAQAFAGAPHSCSLVAIDNESTTASIAACFGACTAALNTAGSFTIAPGQTRVWSGPYVPADAINLIAGSASTPVTIEAHCD